MKINFTSVSGGIILALALSGCSSDRGMGSVASQSLAAEYRAVSAKHFNACLDAGGVPKLIDRAYQGCIEAPNHKEEEW